MTLEAQTLLAKTGIVQFRAEQTSVSRLFKLANAKNIRMSAMVREWVMERLAQEEGQPRVQLDVVQGKKKLGVVILNSM